MSDFILDGRGSGEVGEFIANHNSAFDVGLYRPYVERDGNVYVTVNTGKRWDDKLERYVPVTEARKAQDMLMNGALPLTNATSLRKDEWKQIDSVVRQAARRRLTAWTDLANANTYGGFNGFGRTILETEAINDPGEALVDMDVLTEGRADQPQFSLQGLPLPVTHGNFWFSKRKLDISRNGNGTPLDMAMVEAVTHKVAEKIEQTVIGTATGMTYGVTADYDLPSASAVPSVHGYTNFDDRNTKTDLTASSSATGETILDDILAMRELNYADYHYGPFMCYVSTAYDALLDDDFKANSDKTTRQRIRDIDNIMDVKRLDYLTGDVMLLVQMTSDVARAVDGMDFTTIQWESKGGMQVNFKVMAIKVPHLRSDASGRTGICHGTTS